MKVTVLPPGPAHKLNRGHRPFQSPPSSYSDRIARQFQTPDQVRSEIGRWEFREKVREAMPPRNINTDYHMVMKPPAKVVIRDFVWGQDGKYHGLGDETGRALFKAGWILRFFTVMLPERGEEGVVFRLWDST